MVDVDFVLKNRSAKPLRAYTLHCEEVWEDAQVGDGSARQDRRYPVTEARGDELQASFRVRAKAKLKCRIASIEFEDETGWKPNMSQAEKREKAE
jgi:hypothetical protein